MLFLVFFLVSFFVFFLVSFFAFFFAYFFFFLTEEFAICWLESCFPDLLDILKFAYF